MPALTLDVPPRERDELQRLLRSGRRKPALATRARIVLLAGQGLPNAAIARSLGVSRPTVTEWRRRYAAGGVAALSDQPRSGRPPTVDEIRVVAATLTRPPRRLGGERWSTRSLAAELDVSMASVGRVWRRWRLRPHDGDPLRLPVDPPLDPWCQEVLGLYLKPPECAIAVTADPRRPVPTLDELTHPPANPRARGTWAADDLVARMRLTAHRVTDSCPAPRPHEVFLDFLANLGRRHAGRALHVVVNDHSSLEHPETRMWLQRSPAVRIYRAADLGQWVQASSLLLCTAMISAGHPDPLGGAGELADAVRRSLDGWEEMAGALSWTDTVISPFSR